MAKAANMPLTVIPVSASTMSVVLFLQGKVAARILNVRLGRPASQIDVKIFAEKASTAKTAIAVLAWRKT